MAALALAGLALTAVGTYSNYKRSQGIAREQQAAGHRKAALIEAETAEQKRRERKKQQEVEGMAVAAAAASGTEMLSESTQQTLTGIYEEHKRQLDWLDLSGRRAAREAVQEGETAARNTRHQAQASVIDFFSGAATSGYSIGKDAGWWGVGKGKKT